MKAQLQDKISTRPISWISSSYRKTLLTSSGFDEFIMGPQVSVSSQRNSMPILSHTRYRTHPEESFKKDIVLMKLGGIREMPTLEGRLEQGQHFGTRGNYSESPFDVVEGVLLRYLPERCIAINEVNVEEESSPNANTEYVTVLPVKPSESGSYPRPDPFAPDVVKRRTALIAALNAGRSQASEQALYELYRKWRQRF